MLYTVKSQKKALVKFDRKRYWLNAVESIAFEHPDINIASSTSSTSSHEIMETHVPKKKRCIEETTPDYHSIDLNQRKLKKVEGSFMTPSSSNDR